MKKILIPLFLLCATFIFAKAEGQSAVQSGSEFIPDNEAGMTINEVRQQFGSIPKVTGRIMVGAVAKSFTNEYWRAVREGYLDGADEVNAAGLNVTVDVKSAMTENDEEGQLAILNNMVNQKYSMLLLSPISDGNLIPGVESAIARKIPVLNVTDGLISIAPYFVGAKADSLGELAAEWVGKKLNGQGEVAVVIGMPKAFAARQRTLGFTRYMGQHYPNIKVVAEQNADWDRNRARELATTWIKNFPNLKAVFCNNDTMALGVVEAVKESGKNILVVGVDGIGEAYDSIRKGELSATVDQYPYYTSLISLECGLRAMGGQKLPRVIWSPAALIDQTNVNIPPKDIIKWAPLPF
jgi:ribose transport system substrate-binding protein